MSAPLDIVKLDIPQRLVFGWANVAVKADGVPLEDTQDDLIDTDVLEKAAYDFVLEFREADEMHTAAVVGQLVESMMFTPDKLVKMGLAADAIQPRWWVGFKLSDEAFAKVQRGEYRMFSIGGTGTRIAA